jgi:hypothetical protein
VRFGMSQGTRYRGQHDSVFESCIRELCTDAHHMNHPSGQLPKLNTVGFNVEDKESQQCKG